MVIVLLNSNKFNMFIASYENTMLLICTTLVIIDIIDLKKSKAS